jgi:hypothetical protein
MTPDVREWFVVQRIITLPEGEGWLDEDMIFNSGWQDYWSQEMQTPEQRREALAIFRADQDTGPYPERYRMVRRTEEVIEP